MATRKAAAKTPAGKTAAKQIPPTGILLPVSHEEHWRMVAEAAYYLAQKRGFVGGDALADWVAAEAEVDAKLRTESRKPGPS